jgi:putative hydrolase of the HAD superfamily
MQQSKVKALNLEEQFDLILYVRQISLRKPDPRIFQYVLHQTNLSPAEAVYVGDHPLKDIVVARRVGLLAVRVMTGEFRSLPDDPFYPPNYYLASLNDLPKIIHSVNTFVGI